MMAIFFAGIACAAFGASGVFFFKFWRASRDPFFFYFTIACWLLAIERCAILALDRAPKAPEIGSESGIWVYLIRLVAFVVILIGVIQKNKRGRAPR